MYLTIEHLALTVLGYTSCFYPETLVMVWQLAGSSVDVNVKHELKETGFCMTYELGFGCCVYDRR